MAKTKNSVFIATSLDGFIADVDGNIGWLDSIPEINQVDTGYIEFISNIDAILMGRKSFEVVMGFGIEWPYEKPVFVASNSLKIIPIELENKVFIISGTPQQMIDEIHNKGFIKL